MSSVFSGPVLFSKPCWRRFFPRPNRQMSAASAPIGRQRQRARHAGLSHASAGQRTIPRGGYRFIYEDYSQDDFTGRGRFVWDMQQRGPVLGLAMLF